MILLVGKNREGFTLFLQHFQKIDDAIVRFRAAVTKLRIFLLHFRNKTSHVFLGPFSFREGTPDQPFHPFSDEFFVRLHRMFRKAMLSQRAVHGLGQIFDGIEQSSVQIEKHPLKTHFLPPAGVIFRTPVAGAFAGLRVVFLFLTTPSFIEPEILQQGNDCQRYFFRMRGFGMIICLSPITL